MNKIDKFILGMFQYFSNFFEDLIGINNFWFARLCIVVLSLLVLFMLLMPFYSQRFIFAIWLLNYLIQAIVSWGVLYFFSKEINSIEKTVVNNPSARNSLEITAEPIRKGLLYGGLYLIVATYFFGHKAPEINSEDILNGFENNLAAVTLLLIICFIYLISCTPNPRKTSKVKRLLKKLRSLGSSKQVILRTVRV